MDDVLMMPTAEVPRALLLQLRELVFAAFGASFTEADWQHALGGQHFLVLRSGVLLGHAAVVPRELWVRTQAVSVGYVEAVATRPAYQGRGIGTLLMREVAKVICDKFDIGALSTSSHTFYERLGWERWLGPTFVRENGAELRTPDEDAGLMVLRSHSSPALDLRDRILCEARAGDDW